MKNLWKPSALSSAGLSKRKLSLGVGFAYFCASTAFMPVQSVHAESASANEANVIEEIIVTARKREESLQDTPVVISALSSQTIADFAINSVEEISDFIPGLVADAQGGSAGGLLYLRGIGSATASAAIDQAVSLVIDDMQVGTLQMQNSAMIDMESVQVYKGPQALFFGKNSPGGVLSIRTADPGDEFEAQAKTGYEFEGEEWFVQGVLSGPFSDTAAGRLVVRYTETDGLFDVDTGPFEDSFGGKLGAGENLFARGTLILQPSEVLSIRAKLTYNDTDNETSGTTHLQRVNCPLGDPQLNFFAPPYPCKADGTHYLAPVPQAAIDALGAAGASIGPTGAWENEQKLVAVAVDYDISDTLSLTSITGYYDVSSLGSGPAFGLLPAPAVAAQNLEFDQFTQELRLASDFDGPLNFVAGLYYEDKTHDYFQPVTLTSSGFVAVREYDQDTEAMSAFVDVTWNITDDVELSGGVRYSDEEKTFKTIRGYTEPEQKESWDDVSPQVTLSWHASEEWMLFASYREGFKSGGFDGAFSFAPTPIASYEPEEVDGFEVGAKGILLDNTLQLSVAAFRYEYDQLQLSTFNAQTLSLAIVNAAAAKIQGVEADFSWVTPADGLQVRGSIGVLDSEFTEYLAPCYEGQSIAAGCDQGFNGTAFNAQDLGGEPLNLAADYVATLGVLYEQEVGGMLLGLSMDATFSDDYETSTERIPNTAQDSYARLNAAISLASLKDTWSVTLIGRNLTDEYTITTGTNQPGTGRGTGTAASIPADAAAYVRPGRTLALQIGFKF